MCYVALFFEVNYDFVWFVDEGECSESWKPPRIAFSPLMRCAQIPHSKGDCNDATF